MAKTAKIFAATYAAAIASVLLAPSNALAVTTWNWSFTATNNVSGSGTFTTADVVPAANTPYQITGISGTINQCSTVNTITGLDSTWLNIFAWDGTSSSPILVQGLERIGFLYSGGSANITQTSSPGFSSVSNYTDNNFNSEFINSSSLAPVSSPPGPSTGVPGPFPLLGAAAAFQASRRLRRRLNGSLPTS
jgi:hypothetical protein